MCLKNLKIFKDNVYTNEDIFSEFIAREGTKIRELISERKSMSDYFDDNDDIKHAWNDTWEQDLENSSYISDIYRHILYKIQL